MPIVDVELVAGPDEMPAVGLAQSLADAVGRSLDSPPGQTWVRLRVLARECYAENGSSLDDAALPVFVTVLKRQPAATVELAGEIAALTNTIAQWVGRPMTCVHIEYETAAIGRVSFGGRLVE